MRFTTHSTAFTWDNTTFNVEFDFFPGCTATREEPGEDDFVDVISVKLDGSNIELGIDLFCDAFQTAMNAHCLASVSSSDEDRAADRFDALLTNDELVCDR